MKTWQGPTPRTCDLCSVPFDKTYVDGRLRAGHWAALCWQCHQAYGVGLGTGRGQKYKREGSIWVQVVVKPAAPKTKPEPISIVEEI